MNRSGHGRSIPLVAGVVFSFIWLIATIAVAAGPVVIDHTSTDLSKIPESAVSQAKADLHIAYGHTSHGSQLISGMGTNGTALDDFLTNSPKYNITPGLYVWNEGGHDGALDLDDWAMQGDAGQYPTWVDNTRTYLGDPDPVTGRGDNHSAVNVIIWSWCGQVSTITAQSMIDTYLAPMTQLELDYPGVTFVYMTGHLDGSGEAGNLHLRNEQIRDYCRTNDKILYDFADIESYDPDGLVNYMPLMALDNCAYDSDGNGTRDRNWAIEWQDSYVEGVDWWASGASHSQHLNGNLKGYAAWWLWAVLGGWNSCLPAPSGLTADADSVRQEIVLNWTDNSSGESSFILQRQVDGGTWDNNHATFGAGTTTYTDTGLAAGTYSYRVVAHLNDDGTGSPCDSTASNVAPADITGSDPPPVPLNFRRTDVR